jgi:chromosomal replication initiation ATPase DnaA
LREWEQQILNRAANFWGVTVDDMVGTSKTKRLVEARRVAINGLRDAGLSYPEIGLIFGRHHTTIQSAFKRQRPPRPNLAAPRVPEFADLSGEWAI